MVKLKHMDIEEAHERKVVASGYSKLSRSPLLEQIRFHWVAILVAVSFAVSLGHEHERVTIDR